MIDDDKIVKAASKLCDYGSIHDSEYRIEGFKKCAKWMQEEFLKDLWHPASEIPCEGKYLVVEYNVTDTIKDYLSFKRLEGYLGWNWIPYCKSANVTQWLYIDDLLPKEGCEQ